MALASALWLAPPAVSSAAAGSYLQVSGRNFTYAGQTVVLRGEDFNNEPALSCCGGPDIGAINYGESDYAKVQAWGGNVIRWSMDYAWWASDRTRFFAVADQHVAWARAHRLWLIVTMMIPPGGSSGGYDQSAGKGYCIWSDCGSAQHNQDALNTAWRSIAAHFAREPAVAGYDLFNEPAPPSQGEWQQLAQRLHDTILAVDPNHFVAVEISSAGWDVPAVSGANMVWSVHHYQEGNNYPPSWSGQVPLWVGEFGAQPKSADAPAWVAAQMLRYARDGVHWTHFVMREGNGDYGLYACGAASDFSCPWPEMIQVVSQAMARSVQPLAGAAGVGVVPVFGTEVGPPIHGADSNHSAQPVEKKAIPWAVEHPAPKAPAPRTQRSSGWFQVALAGALRWILSLRL